MLVNKSFGLGTEQYRSHKFWQGYERAAPFLRRSGDRLRNTADLQAFLDYFIGSEFWEERSYVSEIVKVTYVGGGKGLLAVHQEKPNLATLLLPNIESSEDRRLSRTRVLITLCHELTDEPYVDDTLLDTKSRAQTYTSHYVKILLDAMDKFCTDPVHPNILADQLMRVGFPFNNDDVEEKPIDYAALRDEVASWIEELK